VSVKRNTTNQTMNSPEFGSASTGAFYPALAAGPIESQTSFFHSEGGEAVADLR
jgi:hypothetical protein